MPHAAISPAEPAVRSDQEMLTALAIAVSRMMPWESSAVFAPLHVQEARRVWVEAYRHLGLSEADVYRMSKGAPAA